MNGEIVVGVFKELAIVKGVRTAEGEWTGDWADLRTTLKEAMKLVADVTEEIESK